MPVEYKYLPKQKSVIVRHKCKFLSNIGQQGHLRMEIPLKKHSISIEKIAIAAKETNAPNAPANKHFETFSTRSLFSALPNANNPNANKTTNASGNIAI